MFVFALIAVTAAVTMGEYACPDTDQFGDVFFYHERGLTTIPTGFPEDAGKL